MYLESSHTHQIINPSTDTHETAKIDSNTVGCFSETAILDALVDAARTNYVDDRWVCKSAETSVLEAAPPAYFKLLNYCTIIDYSDYHSWMPWLLE